MTDRPIATPLSQKVEDFRHRYLPLVVWGVSTLVVVGLMVQRTTRYQYIGVAHSPVYEVSVDSPMTIETLVVSQYDEVKKGDIVAKMEDDALLASLATAEATVSQLSAELEATRAATVAGTDRNLADWQADLRRFQVDEEQRRLEVLSQKVVIEGDQVELEFLALELLRSRPMVESGLISDQEFDALEARHQQVRKMLDENKILLQQTEQEYRTALERREGFQKELPNTPRPDSVLLPLVEAINVAGRQLEEIQIQRREVTLRSPVDGQVSQILCRRGQSVVPGEPIVLIAEHSVQEIVAYLNDADVETVRPATPVLVTSRTRPGPTAETVVLRVGSNVDQLPQRLWRDPRIPDYGRAVVIAANPGMSLLPGEVVTVRFVDD